MPDPYSTRHTLKSFNNSLTPKRPSHVSIGSLITPQPATPPPLMPGRVHTLKTEARATLPIMESCQPVLPIIPGRVHTMATPVLSLPLPAPPPPPPPPPAPPKRKARPPPEPPVEPGSRAWKIKQFITTHFQK